MDSREKSNAGRMGDRVEELKAEEFERRIAPVAGSLSGNDDGDLVPTGKSRPRLI